MQLTGSYSPLLVFLSVVVASAASYTALEIAGRLSSVTGRARLGWLLVASLALGVGIWSMHFVGMLAFHLPIPVAYGVGLVLLSVLVAIAASGLALVIVGRPGTVGFGALTLAALCMGPAIAGMHYVGMAAMRMQARLGYRPELVAASIGIAIGASFVALWLFRWYRVTNPSRSGGWRVVSGVVMGGAIAGMHYTAMAAAHFTADPDLVLPPAWELSPSSGLGLAVACGTLLILGLARTAELQRLNLSLQLEIAERKHTEAELRERTAQLDELFNQAPEAIVLLTTHDEVLRVNREFSRVFGYAATEALGKSINDLVVPDDLSSEGREFTARTTERGERVEAETIRRTKDGNRVHVSLVASPVVVAGSQIGAYVIYRDITDRKLLENELRRSEAYLAAGQRLSHTGSWARRVATGDSYWSKETFRIFGLDPATSTMRDELLRRFWHPDDRDLAEETIAAAIREKRRFEMGVRIVRPDGSIRYLHTLGRPILGEGGEVVELMGVVMDVTERKRAERALRRARERALAAHFTAVLDERTRLAREIHDTLLQGFTGVALNLVATSSRVSGPPEVIAALHDLVTLSQKTLEDARQAIWDMRSPSLAGGDFAGALRTTAEDRLHGTGVAFELGIEGTPRPLDPEVEAAVFRVAQEAIANVVKHAAAQRVQIKLSYQVRGVRLSVLDDGRGFAVPPDLHAYGGHWGLLGMRERANQMRGRLLVQSEPGRGTEVVLLIPYALRHQGTKART
jgi:PAS domain S-box-containing protein